MWWKVILIILLIDLWFIGPALLNADLPHLPSRIPSTRVTRYSWLVLLFVLNPLIYAGNLTVEVVEYHRKKRTPKVTHPK